MVGIKLYSIYPKDPKKAFHPSFPEVRSAVRTELVQVAGNGLNSSMVFRTKSVGEDAEIVVPVGSCKVQGPRHTSA